jgi:K+-transporting ATPase c subunit
MAFADLAPSSPSSLASAQAPTNPQLDRVHQSKDARLQKIPRFAQLRIGRDAVTEAAQRRDAAGLDKVNISLAALLAIPFVRHAEHVQMSTRRSGGISGLEAGRDVGVAGVDEEEFAPVGGHHAG